MTSGTMPLSSAQKASLATLIIGYLVAICGFVAPYWIVLRIDVPGLSVYGESGLIFSCGQASVLTGYKCDTIPWTTTESYFVAARILAAVSTFFILIGFGAVINACCSRNTSVLPVGVLSIVAGLAGIAAIVNYAVMSKDIFTELVKPVIDYGWAFYLSAVASGGILLMGIGAMLLPKGDQFIYPTLSGISNQSYALETPYKTSQNTQHRY